MDYRRPQATTRAYRLAVPLRPGIGRSSMLAGLPKFAGAAVRSRASSPKLQVLDTALLSALSGYDFAEARADREYWGRQVESAVGAHLANAAAAGECELFYWRERNREVDLVVRAGRRLTAIEVKSGRAAGILPGVEAFAVTSPPARGGVRPQAGGWGEPPARGGVRPQAGGWGERLPPGEGVAITVGLPAVAHIPTLHAGFLDYCDDLNLDATFEPERI